MINKCKQIRQEILRMGGSHIVSCFSCVEILVALYYGGILRFDPQNPRWQERDRFILSKGHAGKALYCILEDLKFFGRGLKEKFSTHPTIEIPGVEISSGSLGHGLGISCGRAYALKMDNKLPLVFCLMGDAECNEGSIWESAMFASQNRLNNLIAIIDRNYMGATSFTETSLKLEPFMAKWEAFGWQVSEVNGHKIEEIKKSLEHIRKYRSDKPTMIIATTMKGKGVSFMENDSIWHVQSPTKEEIEKGLKELG